MEHVRLIDSLRGVAAALVLVSHVAFWTGGSNIDVVGGFLARGDSGVAVFFAISAFLLLSPAYAKALQSDESPARDWGSYAWRRAARIMPAYWLALAGVLAVGYFASTPDGVGSIKKILIHIFLGQALFVEQYQGFSQTWSLTTEVTFYLLVPLLSWLIIRFTVRRSSKKVAFSIAVLLCTVSVGLATQAIAFQLVSEGRLQAGAALGTSVVGHASWFAAGALVAMLIHAQRLGHFSDGDSVLANAGRWLLAQSRSTLMLSALAVYALAATGLAGPRDLSSPELGEVIAKEALYSLFALLLLLAAVKPITPKTTLDSFASSDVNQWIGNTSYGVFLWHLVVLQVVFMLNDSILFNAHFGWTLQLVVTMTLVIASASWFFVENPILTWVRKRTTSARAPIR